MRFKEKLLILLVAVILTVWGFNLISSPFADLLILAKQAGYERIDCYFAACGDDVFQTRPIIDKASRYIRLSAL
jgi:hypothetical protein